MFLGNEMVMKEVALKYIALETSIDSGDWEQSEQWWGVGEKRRPGASGRQGSFASRHCICNDSGLSFPMAVRDAMRLCPSASSHHARQHAPTEGGLALGNGERGRGWGHRFRTPGSQSPSRHILDRGPRIVHPIRLCP